MQTKAEKRTRRQKRIRAKIAGTAKKPRLSVFKSNKFITAQIINDEKGETLAQASSKDSKGKTGIERAQDTGKAVAEAAKKAKIEEVVFDRGGYIFTGQVKALADAAREAGLKF